MRTLVKPSAAAIALAFLIATGPSQAAAETLYQAHIDGSQVDPPRLSLCVGFGTFILDDDGFTLHYSIHFDPWVTDEFVSHIHELPPPEGGPEIILIDLPGGPNKVGQYPLEPADVLALQTRRLFVNVHTTRFPMGEVRGYIILATPTLPASWGQLKAIYR